MSGKEQLAIAVMGPTGSGKSSFLNLLMKDGNFKVGHSLKSETYHVQLVEAEIDGQPVAFIDTPGFDDTLRPDTEVLKSISEYLAATFAAGRRLSGLLYLHRITDNRVGGVSARNIDLFEKLCGEEALKNVVLCTTMWDLVSDAEQQNATNREEELKTVFWKRMVSRGSGLARHLNTRESALGIVRNIIRRPPIELKIQQELVTEDKLLSNTGAGAIVFEGLLRLLTAAMEEADSLRQKETSLRYDYDDREEFRRDREREEAKAARIRRDRAALLVSEKPRYSKAIELAEHERERDPGKSFFSRLWRALTIM